MSGAVLVSPAEAPTRAGPGRRRLALALGLTWLLVTGWAATGIGARATYGARVTADEPQYLLSAISLAEDHDLDIADELAERRWRAFHAVELPEQTRLLPGGRRLSPHDPLLPLLLAGPVALGGWVGAKLALAAMAGALAALLVWTAVRRLGVGLVPALAAVGVMALSPPLAVYATQVYPELPAALAVAVGLAAVTGPPGRRGPGWWVAAGLAVVALPWFGVKYAPVAAVLALAVAWRLAAPPPTRPGGAWGWRPLLAWAGALALAGVVYVAAHLAIYGGLTPYAVGDHFVGGELDVVGTEPNYLGRSTRLAGLLTDREFGLIAWQPAWLLAVPALAALARRRTGGWAAVTGVLAAGWLTASFVALTMHGWWWPGRQVVAVLPAAVLVLAWWAGQAGRSRVALLAGVGALGVVNLAWVLAEARAGRLTLVVDFMATTSPLYRAWSVLLPALRTPEGWWTWVLHGLWLAVLAGAAVLGWRGAGRQPAGR